MIPTNPPIDKSIDTPYEQTETKNSTDHVITSLFSQVRPPPNTDTRDFFDKVVTLAPHPLGSAGDIEETDPQRFFKSQNPLIFIRETEMKQLYQMFKKSCFDPGIPLIIFFALEIFYFLENAPQSDLITNLSKEWLDLLALGYRGFLLSKYPRESCHIELLTLAEFNKNLGLFSKKIPSTHPHQNYCKQSIELLRKFLLEKEALYCLGECSLNNCPGVKKFLSPSQLDQIPSLAKRMDIHIELVKKLMPLRDPLIPVQNIIESWQATDLKNENQLRELSNKIQDSFQKIEKIKAKRKAYPLNKMVIMQLHFIVSEFLLRSLESTIDLTLLPLVNPKYHSKHIYFARVFNGLSILTQVSEETVRTNIKLKNEINEINKRNRKAIFKKDLRCEMNQFRQIKNIYLLKLQPTLTKLLNKTNEILSNNISSILRIDQSLKTRENCQDLIVHMKTICRLYILKYDLEHLLGRMVPEFPDYFPNELWDLLLLDSTINDQDEAKDVSIPPAPENITTETRGTLITPEPENITALPETSEPPLTSPKKPLAPRPKAQPSLTPEASRQSVEYKSNKVVDLINQIPKTSKDRQLRKILKKLGLIFDDRRGRGSHSMASLNGQKMTISKNMRVGGRLSVQKFVKKNLLGEGKS